jgi:hypothetical protein
MINNLLKIGLFYQLWRWFKPRLNSLVISFTIIVFTWIFHSEYTDYLAESNSVEYLGISYFIKWAITIGVIFAFYIRETLSQRSAVKPATSKSEKKPVKPTKKRDTIAEPDPFDNIRNKNHLESRADKLLNKMESK